jgi:hypothetical protein
VADEAAPYLDLPIDLEGRTARQVLEDLDGDAEFKAQVDLCPPGSARGRTT